MNNSQNPAGQKLLFINMYRTLVGVGTICGLIIVVVYQFTAPIISANKEFALEKAIFNILPKAKTKHSFYQTDNGNFVLQEANTDKSLIHVGYNEKNQIVGFAIPAQGMGYQDSIHILYAYEALQERIIGMQVLQSRETPGLGSRIEDDPDFLANFKQLDVRLDLRTATLINPIQMVKPGKKTQPWQIDSISGATVSSQAIGKIIQQSVIQWLPRIRQHYKDFELGD